MRAKSEYPTKHADQHLPWGSDPLHGFPAQVTGPGLEDIILGTVGLDAFWKLNESSGVVAHDSSGNGNDLTATAPYGPPTWGQAAGPPGETTAYFGTADAFREAATLTARTNNFSFGSWVNMGVTGGDREIMGQGQGGFHIAGAGGWALLASTTKFAIGSNASLISANNVYTTGTWYLVVGVRDAGTWKLYVNGLLQAATMSTSPGAGVADTWLGNCGQGGGGHGAFLYDSLLSYAFLVNNVLSGGEILAMYEAGTGSGFVAADEVWTTDGAGSASWQPNLKTIAKTGSTGLTGAVTLTGGSGVTLTQAGQDISIAATGGAPGGAAGGALDGTYPNPGLAASVAGAGLAETSDVLSVNVDNAGIEISADTLRLKDTAVTAASYGDATHVGQFTVDAKGRITTASNVVITGSDPALDTKVWMPLVDTDGTVVLDSNGVIPTLITL